VPAVGDVLLSLQGTVHVERSAPAIPSKLFVGSLNDVTTSTSLRKHFEVHAPITEAVVITDRGTRSGSADPDAHASVFHPADTELSEIIREVLAAVERIEPQHVVFDGLFELRLLSGDPLRYRRQLLLLKDFFANKSMTVPLLDDRSESAAKGSTTPGSDAERRMSMRREASTARADVRSRALLARAARSEGRSADWRRRGAGSPLGRVGG
jgi:hypothetical protein